MDKISKENFKLIALAVCLLVLISCFLPMYTLPFGISRNLISVFDTDTYLLILLTLASAASIYFLSFRWIPTANGIFILVILYNVIAQQDTGKRITPDIGISFLLLLLSALFLIFHPKIMSVVYEQGETNSSDKTLDDEQWKRSSSDKILADEQWNSNSSDNMLLTMFAGTIGILGSKFVEFLIGAKKITIGLTSAAASPFIAYSLRTKCLILFVLVAVIILARALYIFEKDTFFESQAVLHCVNAFTDNLPSVGLPSNTQIVNKSIHKKSAILSFGTEWEILLTPSKNEKFKRVDCEIEKSFFTGVHSSNTNWITSLN